MVVCHDLVGGCVGRCRPWLSGQAAAVIIEFITAPLSTIPHG
jgi:hypothetical protein